MELRELCRRIEELYAQGLSGLDTPLLDLLLDLGNRTGEILSLIDKETT